MQPIGSRRDPSTPQRWVPVDELLAAVDARQDAGTARRPLSDGQLARALATPPPRNPSNPPAPRTPRGMGRRSRRPAKPSPIGHAEAEQLAEQLDAAEASL